MSTNTLTNLIPAIYASLDVVSRELVGLIPAVTIDARANRIKLGQTLYSPVSPASTAGDITPAATPPALAGQTIGNKSVTISKYRSVWFSWEGEEQAALDSGPGFSGIRDNQIVQAIRTLTNEIEADLAALYVKASRAYGTPGTAPFGTAGDYSDAALARKILVDNGAPTSELQLVIDTTAGANIRGKQSQQYMIGDQNFLRNGVLFDQHGFAIRESAQIKNHTKGTNNGSAAVNNAGYAVANTSLTLASAGTGTLVAGDVVTFAGDTNKYVVTTGDTDVSDGGTLVIGAPGIRIAMSAANKVITTGNSYTANLAFARSAILLATRLPIIPAGGDLARDRMTITDPVSGLSFDFAMYPGYHANSYEVSIAWGVSVVKPEHMAILQG